MDSSSVVMGVNHKSIERVVSQRALQMGSSFPCQVCVFGFLCGVCLTTLFLSAFTSFSSLGSVTISVPAGISSQFNPTPNVVDIYENSQYKIKLVGETDGSEESVATGDRRRERGKESLLFSAWSATLEQSEDVRDRLLRDLGLVGSFVPAAPHLEDCKSGFSRKERLDQRSGDENFPPWTSWKGLLDTHPASTRSEQIRNYRLREMSEGFHPPWVEGSDEENYPLTRRVQRDLWIHQHPPNCSDPNVKFLVADWERIPGFGIGAQFAGMCGVFALALNENRVLVTDYYNRADHDGCRGSSRSSWSCYFFPETSQECRVRALELVRDENALAKGTVTTKANYSSKEIWAGHIIPRQWGEPWNFIQPTTEINGTLVSSHRKMELRWWRAQAMRYLMRFQTEYTCSLMNAARHAAFGKEAAKMVLSSLDGRWLAEQGTSQKSDIDQYVWSSHKPWIPSPLLSMHVRMGDKACEMTVVGFEDYMLLANRIQARFPHLSNIWLSTEMQEVVDKSSVYPSWRFHYTNVTRQTGNMTMAVYEASLGRETSTNYPLVNFLMASEADFFVGALGSTWCYLIDGMRNTGGKVMAGYLSVNKDRFW
ncbi:hypothetical protein MLD38_017891 [Melastoma candidum]|uniref:Uncharacterized protein n=1 Tax=Melastoma candidum TaxID=119954 RepID=A0ACB9QVM3_9MYRT|nr:hypothetical protein MLD38_017891 [Melastoma candidum]